MEKSSWIESNTPESKLSTSSNLKQNVSFKFSKFTPKNLASRKLLDDENLQIQEKILSIDDKKIKSSVPKEEKKALIIQPIVKNNWRKPSSNLDSSKDSTSESSKKSLNDLAIEELLQESSTKNNAWENRSSSIPMVIQNKLPQGFETDERLDVTLRAEDSTLENYEDVPVTEFGTAVLRGLGCNPGDPIGNKNKKCIEPIEAVLRSKGLGLGAERKMTKNSITKGDDGEELKLIKGAYICVKQGNHKDSYGVVEGLDESRVIVKLVHVSQNVSLPALYVDVVSKKVFQKEGKVINRESYYKYKDDQPSNGKDSKHKSDNNEKVEDRTLPDSEEYRSRKSEYSEKHRHSKDRHKSSKHKRKRSRSNDSHKRQLTENWVRPLLRVRFIDGKYKKGKYFNQKMIVEDVVSFQNCICKTEDGKYLEDLQPYMLETVIPRSEPSHVMIVKGKHRPQLGAILSRDKKECTATVQLLSDRSKVVVLDFDSICEYIGDTSMHD